MLREYMKPTFLQNNMFNRGINNERGTTLSMIYVIAYIHTSSEVNCYNVPCHSSLILLLLFSLDH